MRDRGGNCLEGTTEVVREDGNSCCNVVVRRCGHIGVMVGRETRRVMKSAISPMRGVLHYLFRTTRAYGRVGKLKSPLGAGGSE